MVDANGNNALQVIRTVDVVDTTPPVITLVGANPQVIEVGSAYVELGATALDNYDGDITGSIIIDATAVNATVVGLYAVTYDVVDANGNNAVQVIRTVDIVDTTAPIITLVGANPQTIEVGSGYVELGATALDNYDGDITGSIVIDSSAVNTAVVGSYSVTYDVVDANGNPAVQVTRTVDVVDTTIPAITLVGSNPQVINVFSPYVELGATALDNYDGDITGSIVIDSSAVNTAVVGSYSVTYDVVDANGNPAVQVIRTVDVVDTTAPIITLVGANPQIIEVGSGYVELSATALDNYDGDITGSIIIDASAVDTNTVGSYPVTYDVTDANGNTANTANTMIRVIRVLDTNIPVITLIGANPQTIEINSTYVELGATALDLHDGDITASIVIDATAVDIAVVGSYPVIYDVTDSEGNSATQVVRTVDVVNTNLAPTAIADLVVMLEDDEATVFPVANDFDPDGDSIFLADILDISGGTARMVGDQILFTPPADESGTYVVRYIVEDSKGAQSVGTITIEVRPVNDAPHAVADQETIDTYLEARIAVLDNDWDVEGSPLVVSSVTGSEHVEAYLDNQGHVVVRIDSGWTGTETITYSVADVEGAESTGIVEIIVPESTLQASIGLSESLGTASAAFAAPTPSALDGNSIAAGLNVSLIAASFYQTLGALQLPFSFLFIAMFALVFAGTSARMGASFAGSRRTRWSVVMLDRESHLKVMEQGKTAEAIYALDPIATGVIGMGRPKVDANGMRWTPVDSPAGTGLVESRYLTRSVDLIEFMGDARTDRVMRRFGRRLAEGKRISSLVSPRGLIIARGNEVELVPRDDLVAWQKRGPRIGPNGHIPSVARSTIEPFLRSFEATSTYTPQRPHSRSALIPTECWNFPYLALNRTAHAPAWLLYFEYHWGRPKVVGIGLDV